MSVFYHITTPDKAEKILDQGLKISLGGGLSHMPRRKGKIFLFTDAGIARDVGGGYTKGPMAILEVNLPSGTKLSMDKETNKDWWGYPFIRTIAEDIPSGNIRLLEELVGYG